MSPPPPRCTAIVARAFLAASSSKNSQIGDLSPSLATLPQPEHSFDAADALARWPLTLWRTAAHAWTGGE